MKQQYSHPNPKPLHAVVFALLLLAGCGTTAPTAPRAATAPAQFKENGLWKHAGVTAVAPVSQDWWQLFHDTQLDDLQRLLAIGNESLKSAAVQVDSARAAVQAAQAALWPTLSVGAAGSRAGGSATGNAPGSVASSYSLSGNAAWELDLWGRIAQSSDAAQARIEASRDDLAAVRLSAQAALVQTYLSLRAAEAQQALLQRTVAADQRALELTQARYAAGVAAQSDVLQAQTQLRTVQAQTKESAVQRAQLEHAIAVLLGQAPAELTLAGTASLPELPTLPELLPSTLLERRPDIAAAERRVAAAYAQIGVAEAAFFPSITLSASAGYRGSALDQLVNAPNLLWSLGPALAQAVFDGGARQAGTEQARAAAAQAASAYRQTVLTALQEVEDNLVLLEQLGGELQLQREALQAGQRNLQIVQDQYQSGTVSYLNVVSAQTSVLTIEGSLLALRNRQLAAAAQLLKNIGGVKPHQ